MQREDLGFLEIGSRKSIHNHSWLADDIKVISFSLKYRSIQTFSTSSLTVDWLTQLRTTLMVKGNALTFSKVGLAVFRSTKIDDQLIERERGREKVQQRRQKEHHTERAEWRKC